MTSPKKKRSIKRVVRPLTAEEMARLKDARAVAERDREEIVREGREHLKIWKAMREDLEATLEALKERRRQLGLSLADVEQRSGLRKSMLSRLENDQRANPTVLTLQRYAAALGLSLTTKLRDFQ